MQVKSLKIVKMGKKEERARAEKLSVYLYIPNIVGASSFRFLLASFIFSVL